MMMIPSDTMSEINNIFELHYLRQCFIQFPPCTPTQLEYSYIEEGFGGNSTRWMDLLCSISISIIPLICSIPTSSSSLSDKHLLCCLCSMQTAEATIMIIRWCWWMHPIETRHKSNRVLCKRDVVYRYKKSMHLS